MGVKYDIILLMTILEVNMIKIERYSVMNFENAIRGARNPLNSWARSDSYYDENGNYILGENDLALAKKLAKAGSDHRKYLRQIFVSVDITAPLYWWKEYDTYKVATVANSTSTMHKIHSKEFERALVFRILIFIPIPKKKKLVINDTTH